MSNISKKIKDIDTNLMQKLLDFLIFDKPCNIGMSDYIMSYSLCNELIRGTSSQPINEMYNYIQSTILQFLQTSYRKLQAENKENFTFALNKEIDKIKIFCFWLERIFQSLSKIKDIRITHFVLDSTRKCLLLPLHSILFENLNNDINNDRDGKSVDRNIIRNIIFILEQCEIEEPIIVKIDDGINFQGKEKTSAITSLTDNNKIKLFSLSSKILLKEWISTQVASVKKYSLNKASKDIQIYNASEYIASTLKYCLDEDERKSFYFPVELHPILDKYNYHHLITQTNERIKNMEQSGLHVMFDNDKQDDLKNVYQLYIRAPENLESIKEVLKVSITKKGEEIYNNKDIARDPLKFIPSLIKLKLDYDYLVTNCFNDDYKIIDTKLKAFQKFMNKEHYSKQISNYCDYLMKIGFKGKNDDQIEEELKKIMNIFRCINNKMHFQLEYVKKISERMLTNRTVSMIAERNMISKLKAEQGVTYVSRMSNILEDLDRSKNIIDKFRQQKHQGVIDGIQFNSQILQSGAWEIDSTREFNFALKLYSPMLEKCKKTFEDFYRNVHNSHKLRWVYGAVSH